MYVTVKRFFPTLEKALEWRDQYLRDFHPCGYGTTLELKETADGFVVLGGRWDSCD